MPSDSVHVRRLPRSEPPAVGGYEHRCAGTRATAPTGGGGAVRRSGSTVSAPRTGPHSGRSSAARTTAPGAPRTGAAARHVADRTLRLALEVIDGRRQATSLRAVLAPSVVGLVGALSTAAVPGRSLGAAVVRTVHVRPVGDDTDDVEMFGTYTRGNRVFAVAGRLTARRSASTPAWTLTALRLS